MHHMDSPSESSSRSRWSSVPPFWPATILHTAVSSANRSTHWADRLYRWGKESDQIQSPELRRMWHIDLDSSIPCGELLPRKAWFKPLKAVQVLGVPEKLSTVVYFTESFEKLYHHISMLGNTGIPGKVHHHHDELSHTRPILSSTMLLTNTWYYTCQDVWLFHSSLKFGS